MAEFVRIASRDELPPPNEAREFDCGGGRMVCVANADGRYSAMDNVCLHRGGPLGQGTVANGKVVCPWHGWSFDAQTGEMTPGAGGVSVFPLKIEGNDVLIKI